MSKPNRKLDALVAERIKGFKWWVPNWKRAEHKLRILMLKPWSGLWDEWDGDPAIEPFEDCYREVPYFSFAVESAMDVDAQMAKQGWWLALKRYEGMDGLQHVRAAYSDGSGDPERWFVGTADTAHLAICLAALRARGVPEAEIQAAGEEGHDAA